MLHRDKPGGGRAESALVGAPPTDRHGDPLPPGAVARYGTVRLRHSRPANSISFSPDGKVLASGSWDGTVRLWEVATGKELRWLDVREEARCVAFAPSGRLLAVASGKHGGGGDEVLRLWDPSSGKLVRELTGHLGPVGGLAFSPSGKRLSVMDGNADLRVWDVPEGRLRFQDKRHAEFTSCVAFSSDGKLVALGGRGNRITLWDTNAKKPPRLIMVPPKKNPTRTITDRVGFSPDGKTLAVANYDFEKQVGTLCLLDIATGKERLRFQGHEGRANRGLAFSPDGRSLIVASDFSYFSPLRLWDVTTGKELRHWQAHDGLLRAVAFSPDGKVLASAGGDHTVRLWDPATGKELQPFEGPDGKVACVAFAPDGKSLACTGQDGIIRFCDPVTGKETRRIATHTDGPIAALSFSPDGKRLASAGSDCRTRVWDTATGKRLFEITHRYNSATSVAFSPDGKRLVSICWSGSALLVETATGKTLRTFKGEEEDCSWGPKVAFSSDGKLLAMSRGNRAVHVYDADTGRPVGKLDGPECVVTAIAFAADGRTLASAEAIDGTITSPETPTWPICLWNVSSGRELLRITGHKAGVAWVAFSPDGRTLASAGYDATARLWEVATGKERRRIEGHWAWEVTCVAFAPGGKLLATGSGDTTVLFWGLARPPGDGPQPAPDEKELKGLWADLAGKDAAKAYRAIWALVASPQQAVPFLRKHLKPAVPADPQKLKQLLADLDSTRYTVREKAVQELQKLGELAEPGLKRVLQGKPSLEVRQRVERLLDQLQGPVVAPDRLREIRAVEALERMDTAEARRLLKELATGAAGARLTREATAADARLSARSAAPK